MANLLINGLAVFLVVSATHLVESGSIFGGPLHASCNVDWKFSTSCDKVLDGLVNIIKEWEGDQNCKDGGEKCLYSLVSQSGSEIKAIHETPKKHYKDDLTFSLKLWENGGCSVHGYSTSETWYAHLDYSTNYCNLRNLIDGASLSKDPGFAETTSDKICTQYSSANCDKY